MKTTLLPRSSIWRSLSCCKASLWNGRGLSKLLLSFIRSIKKEKGFLKFKIQETESLSFLMISILLSSISTHFIKYIGWSMSINTGIIQKDEKLKTLKIFVQFLQQTLFWLLLLLTPLFWYCKAVILGYLSLHFPFFSWSRSASTSVNSSLTLVFYFALV